MNPKRVEVRVYRKLENNVKMIPIAAVVFTSLFTVLISAFILIQTFRSL